MALLDSIEEIPNALPGDEIYLASYNRIKQSNTMWRREFSDGALINEKISKDEIHQMGFVLGNEILTVDDYEELGITITGLDYGDLNPGTETDITYGNLETGSESDINYGSLDVAA